jgi:hypothetical protein
MPDPIQVNISIIAGVLPHMTNCVYSNPINLGEDSWAYSEVGCEAEQQTLIQEGDQKFWLDKTISTGDLITIVLLTAIIFGSIFKFIWDFFFKEWKGKT